MQDFILPDIGEGIVECEVVKWLVAEGEQIVEDQAVVEVMTDKALVEIPAKYSGVVTTLYYAEGEIAKVHTPLFAMQIIADAESSSLAPPSRVDKQLMTQDKDVVDEKNNNQITSQVTRKNEIGKALASPAVRRLARELGLDISLVSGSGEKGRVLKDDLMVTKSASALCSSKEMRKEPIKGVKAAMAKHMMHSVFTVPHFTVSDEVSMDKLMEARAELQNSFQSEKGKLSFMAFFIKAMSLALEQFPIINSQVNTDCSEITYFDEHNIGLAVDSKMGLLVPNIKGVQQMSLFEVAYEINELIAKAREGKLGSSELKGGTISISNIGMFGGTVATPVINSPESAIVALGKIQRLPRFDENDRVKAVNIMNVSWSGDHRIIDGATMVKFNNLWKSYLEKPISMLAIMR